MNSMVCSSGELQEFRLKSRKLNLSRQEIERDMKSRFGRVEVCEFCLEDIETYIELMLTGGSLPQGTTATFIVKYTKK